MARVTLQTIADQVGVSRMTVSNAFSRPDPLSTVVHPEEHAPRAPRTRSVAARLLHRTADLLTPADYSPAH